MQFLYINFNTPVLHNYKVEFVLIVNYNTLVLHYHGVDLFLIFVLISITDWAKFAAYYFCLNKGLEVKISFRCLLQRVQET